MSLEALMLAKTTKASAIRSEIIAALPSHRQPPITMSQLVERFPDVLDHDHGAALSKMECAGEVRWIRGDDLVYRIQLTPKVDMGQAAIAEVPV